MLLTAKTDTDSFDTIVTLSLSSELKSTSYGGRSLAPALPFSITRKPNQR
jgi:hypothetical protein